MQEITRQRGSRPGRHHVGTPGAIISECPGDIVGIRILPKGFHRIRHYGLFANGKRAENIATARSFLNVAPPAAEPLVQSDAAPNTARVLPSHARAAAAA